MMNERISSIMVTDVVTAGPDDSLTLIIDLFKKHNVHHVPITDHKKLVGIITTFDLFWLNRPFEDYDEIFVRDVMTKKVAYLGPEDKVGSAAQIFLDNRFHACPIVREEILVGILTSHDVLKYQYKKAYPSEFDESW